MHPGDSGLVPLASQAAARLLFVVNFNFSLSPFLSLLQE